MLLGKTEHMVYGELFIRSLIGHGRNGSIMKAQRGKWTEKQ